jgi:hypothetical protein
MVRVLLSLSLITAIPPPTTVHPAEGNQAHSVVVDMPRVESLEFASPDSWDKLPPEVLRTQSGKPGLDAPAA